MVLEVKGWKLMKFVGIFHENVFFPCFGKVFPLFFMFRFFRLTYQLPSLALMSQDILQRFDDDAQREREKLNLNKLTSIEGAAHLSAYLDFVHRVIVEF